MDFSSQDFLKSPRGIRSQILTALRAWDSRQVAAAVGAFICIGIFIGIATVLIPNPIFGRDIPPVWWNYPVWIATSLFSGMLVASYVKPKNASDNDLPASRKDEKGSKLGMIGTVLAWFAVGCPVCNKIALMALGYSGAITWFAPLQPILAVAALALTGVALVWRLRGQVSCPANEKTASVKVVR